MTNRRRALHASIWKRIFCLSGFLIWVTSAFRWLNLDFWNSRRVEKLKFQAVLDSTSMPRSSSALQIEIAENSEFLKIANFLSEYMYPEHVPPAQRRELSRLELDDLNQRYAERVGKKKFPSVLLKGTVNGQLVGVVGLDCQFLDIPNKRFVELARGDAVGTGMKIVLVIGNLAVATSARRKGYAQQLIKTCELFAKEWGFQDLYLLVHAENTAARRLYQQCGFNVIYTDQSASSVQSTPIGLKSVPTVKLCMGKSLIPAKSTSSSFGSFFFSDLWKRISNPDN